MAWLLKIFADNAAVRLTSAALFGCFFCSSANADAWSMNLDQANSFFLSSVNSGVGPEQIEDWVWEWGDTPADAVAVMDFGGELASTSQINAQEMQPDGAGSVSLSAMFQSLGEALPYVGFSMWYGQDGTGRWDAQNSIANGPEPSGFNGAVDIGWSSSWSGNVGDTHSYSQGGTRRVSSCGALLVEVKKFADGTVTVLYGDGTFTALPMDRDFDAISIPFDSAWAGGTGDGTEDLVVQFSVGDYEQLTNDAASAGTATTGSLVTWTIDAVPY